jgi:tetratricopeptide (TPR) repeat protein
VNVSGKAVFLSYASQDAGAAKRICESLGAAGVEVWFDQSELRGGDAWDAKIRKQIKECALFIPVISAATQARSEGYFRFEWKLAVDRSHLMADDTPFLFPVVIDDTSDAAARVPDKFREVQWTRLKLEETPAELASRVARLLGEQDSTSEVSPVTARRKSPSKKDGGLAEWWWIIFPVFGMALTLVHVLKQPAPRSKSALPPVAAPAEALATTAPLSEAGQLAARARTMSLDKYDSSVDDFVAAEGLIKRALEIDPNDAQIWAVSSLLNFAFRSRGYDHALSRTAAARAHAERALKLDPNSLDGLYALGRWQRDNEASVIAEETFKKVLARQPNHAGALENLARVYDAMNRVEESAALFERAAAQPGGAALARYMEFLLYFRRARFEDADRSIRQSIADRPSANSQAMLAILMLTWKGDPEGAARVLASGPAASRNEARTIWTTALVQLCQRKPEDVLRTLDRFSEDYIQDNWFVGPRAYFVGRAHDLAGRKEAARLAWESGLAVVNLRLKASPENRELHLMRGELLAFLGKTDEATHEARTVAELTREAHSTWFDSEARIYALLGRADEALPLLEKFRAVPVGQDVGWPLTSALLRLDPLWDKLRNDPGFRRLLADTGNAERFARDWP